MWTLVVFGLLFADIDKSFSVSVSGFSSEATCNEAGNKFTNLNETKEFKAINYQPIFSKKDKTVSSISYTVLWSYNCVEVK